MPRGGIEARTRHGGKQYRNAPLVVRILADAVRTRQTHLLKVLPK